MVRSGTTVLPNSKILQPNINPHCLEAFSIQLKPRFGQKSIDAIATAPKMLDWKSRRKEQENRGNTGIHGKRTRWGSSPLKEMERNAPEKEIRRSPPAAPVAGETNRARGRANGYGGEENSPCPRYNPCPRLAAVVPRWWAVVPLGAVVPHTTSGSTAQQPQASRHTA